MTAKKITDKDRFEWLMRKDTEVGVGPPIGNRRTWSYLAYAGYGSEQINAVTKRAAIDAAIRAERKRKERA